MIGTAPRSPAQETNTCSRIGILNSTSDTQTLIGRATNVRNSPPSVA